MLLFSARLIRASFEKIEREFPDMIPSSQSRRKLLSDAYTQMLHKIKESTKVRLR